MRDPDLHHDGWALEDAELYHRRAPATFEIPPEDIRTALETGDFAKLIFKIAVEVDGEEAEFAFERMWVIVRERQGDRYLGLLDNVPNLISENDDLGLGTELPFEPRHVIDVEAADAASREAAAAPARKPWPRT